jgi:hypothetical protein
VPIPPTSLSDLRHALCVLGHARNGHNLGTPFGPPRLLRLPLCKVKAVVNRIAKCKPLFTSIDFVMTGTNINAAGLRGRCPCTYIRRLQTLGSRGVGTVRSAQRSIEAVSLLIHFGADVKTRDPNKKWMLRYDVRTCHYWYFWVAGFRRGGGYLRVQRRVDVCIAFLSVLGGFTASSNRTTNYHLPKNYALFNLAAFHSNDPRGSGRPPLRENLLRSTVEGQAKAINAVPEKGKRERVRCSRHRRWCVGQRRQGGES